MQKLLEKLNYKGNDRIALLNAEDNFTVTLSEELGNVTIDREIDPRFPYNFIIIFVTNISEIETFTPIALHNLLCNGVLWFCYPRRPQRNSAPILIGTLDGNHLMIVVFMVSGWLPSMKTGLL